jgi:hypothetical protein
MSFIPAYLFISVLLYQLDFNSEVYTLFLLPAPVISYFIRRYSHYIWSFLLMHGALIAIYLVFTSNVYRFAAFSIYLIILTAMAYYKKHNVRELTNTTLVLLIPFVLLYIGCYLAKIAEMMQLCFILTIVFVLLYLLNMYLINMEKFVNNHEDMINIPFHQIRNSNNVLIVFLSSLFLICMLTFSLIPIDQFLSALGKLMVRFLRFLVSLLSFDEPEEPMEVEEEQAAAVAEDFPIMEPSYLMEIISKILQWVTTFLVIGFVIALILYFLYQIYQYFYLKSEDVTAKDKVEFLSPFVLKEQAKQEPKKGLRNLFGRSNNTLIRKYFIRAVNISRDPQKKLNQSLTPTQLSDYILTKPIPEPIADLIPTQQKDSLSKEVDGGEEIRNNLNAKKLITDYYEKARYSNEECTKEEVQLVKKLLSRNKQEN